MRISPKSLLMIIALLFLAVTGYAVFSFIPSVAKTRVESMLNEAGFRHVKIDNLSVSPMGFEAKDIALDEFGFDKINTLAAKVNWPAFLMTGKSPNVLDIRGMSISRKSDTLSYGIRGIAENLTKIEDFTLTLSDLTLDVSTPFGDIRAVLNAIIQPVEKDTHEIKATFVANQYQLGFTSDWQGKLQKGGKLDLAGNFTEGRMNLGPLRLSRSNGWLALSMTETGYSVQNQFEAGAATFMDVPLQSLSIVNDLSSEKSNSIVRAGISGMPDILFTADYIRNLEDQSLTAILKGKNLGGFLDFIEEQTKTQKSISEELLALRDFQITGQFQPDKRFVGGPLPFGIVMTSVDEKIMDGNILIYPDTFEVRGSLETTEEMAQALQSYFKIPSEQVKQNFIRLDGDAKKLLKFGEAPKQ